MRIIRYLLLIFISLNYLTSNSGHCQTFNISEKVNYKCIYAVKKPDGIHQAESENFVLLIGDLYTLFLGETKMLFDSTRKETDNISILLGITPRGSNGFHLSKEKVLFSRGENIFVVEDKPPVSTEMYYTEKNIINWKIMNEYKSIDDWDCQKAQTVLGGRVYEVWFTREVPLSVGPYKFFGLPGLIVNAHDENCIFDFQLKRIQKIDYPKMIEFSTNEVIKSTKKRIQDIYITFSQNPRLVLEAAGMNAFDENGNSLLDKVHPLSIPEFIEVLD